MKKISKSQLFTIVGSLVLIVLLYLAPNKSATQVHKEVLGVDAKINKAVSIVKEGKQPMKGIMLLREVLEEDPNNVRALYQLGVFSVQSGQLDKAIERFKQVLKIEEKNTDALFYLGHAYANTGETDLALKQFEKIKANSDNEELIREANKYITELKSIKENAKR